MQFNGENVVTFIKYQLLMLDNNHMTGLYNVTVQIWPSEWMKSEKRIGPAKNVVICDVQIPNESRVLCSWMTEEE